MKIPTVKVLWKEGTDLRERFGDINVVINKNDFDPDIHERIPVLLKKREAKVNIPPIDEGKRSLESCIEDEIVAMHEEDPEKENADFWLKDGRPEVKELRKRLETDDISASLRDSIYEEWSENKLSGSETG